MAAEFRAKKLNDNKARVGENEINDLFLASAGCEAIMNIYFMAYLKQLQNFTFVGISEIIRKKQFYLLIFKQDELLRNDFYS